MKCHYGVYVPDLKKRTDKESTGEDVGSTVHPFQAENSITSAKSAFFAQRRRRITNQPTAVLSNYVFWVVVVWVCLCVCVWC
jgi:hypothetical protein